MLPSRKSWCCEFGHIAVLDSTRASSQYCGFITEGLLVVVWKVLTYVVYILQNDDQYRRNPKIIKIGQNNQTFHILYIWLLVCQYRTSTHVQIKCLKTTMQWVPMHGLGLAIGPYIVSIIINIYIYIPRNSRDNMFIPNRLAICFRKRGGNWDLVAQSNATWSDRIPKIIKYWLPLQLLESSWSSSITEWTRIGDQYISALLNDISNQHSRNHTAPMLLD